MTLDDETAARIAREVEVIDGGKATRVYLHPKDVALVRAGYAARDAEVEELRVERDRLRDAVESTDRMVESFEKWCTRALTAEATLAKVREWAEALALQPDPPADDEMGGQINAAGDVLAILDEGRE